MNVTKIRRGFPILQRRIRGKPLVYLDNAATSQKPRQVIDAISNYYENHNANVHRGIHKLGDEATALYAEARRTIADFIGAKFTEELVFVRNTTEAINLVAYSWGMENVGKGDVILVTEMEHHSNIVPWQELAKRVGGKVEFVKVSGLGELDEGDLEKKLRLKPKLVAIAHASNFLGTINPVREIVSYIRNTKYDIRVLVDGAQAVPHMPVDVSKLGVDFYAFSGHKMLGPMGIGGLWVKKEILTKMPAFLSGGGTISEVYKDKTVFAKLPDRFDGGTPNVAGAVGLTVAVEYLRNVGMKRVYEHEKQLTKKVVEELRELKFVSVYGPEDIEKRGGLVAFKVKGVHAHDVAQILDSEGIAVRSGHHCVMPMHSKLKIAASTRASFALYNTEEETDRLIEGLNKVKKVFKI